MLRTKLRVKVQSVKVGKLLLLVHETFRYF